MTLGVGNIVALICIVISVVFAVVTNQATNAFWGSLRSCGGTYRHPGADRNYAIHPASAPRRWRAVRRELGTPPA